MFLTSIRILFEGFLRNKSLSHISAKSKRSKFSLPLKSKVSVSHLMEFHMLSQEILVLYVYLFSRGNLNMKCHMIRACIDKMSYRHLPYNSNHFEL